MPRCAFGMAANPTKRHFILLFKETKIKKNHNQPEAHSDLRIYFMHMHMHTFNVIYKLECCEMSVNLFVMWKVGW